MPKGEKGGEAMSVKDILQDQLPASDFPEIVYRLTEVRKGLEEVDDDYSRQEVYDRISMSAIVIDDVISDIVAIERVMRAVVDA